MKFGRYEVLIRKTTQYPLAWTLSKEKLLRLLRTVLLSSKEQRRQKRYISRLVLSTEDGLVIEEVQL